MTSTERPDRHQQPTPFTAGQIVLWLTVGMLSTFLLVSAVFAIKFGIDGRLPFSPEPRPKQPGEASGAPPKGTANPRLVAGAADTRPSDSARQAEGGAPRAPAIATNGPQSRNP